MPDAVTNSLIFQWGGENVFLINWDTGKSKLFCSLDKAAKTFWDSLDAKFGHMGGQQLSFLNPKTRELKLQVDLQTRQIWHDWYDPETGFLLTEIEKRGGANGNGPQTPEASSYP